MKIQKFKISDIEWDVPKGCEEDFEECQRSGSVKPCYIVELAEDEDQETVIPQQLTLQSGWRPYKWTAQPFTPKTQHDPYLDNPLPALHP